MSRIVWQKTTPEFRKAMHKALEDAGVFDRYLTDLVIIDQWNKDATPEGAD